MNELAPGFTLVEEERHAHHWIGRCDDLVLAFLFEGSHDDVRHIEVASRVIAEHVVRRGAPVKVLIVIAPHGKPPSAAVRQKMREEIALVEPHVARSALVLAGAGFASAVQRGVATGILALLRVGVDLKIVGEIRAALEFLTDPRGPLFAPLLLACERLLRGEAPTTPSSPPRSARTAPPRSSRSPPKR